MNATSINSVRIFSQWNDKIVSSSNLYRIRLMNRNTNIGYVYLYTSKSLKGVILFFINLLTCKLLYRFDCIKLVISIKKTFQ